MVLIYQINTDSFTCFECEYGKYRLESTINEECIECDNNMICNGRNNIYVTNDHYVTQYNNQFYSYQCKVDSCCTESV